MKFSRILLIVGAIAGWMLAYTLMQTRNVARQDVAVQTPILLGKLPDLPPIVLPSLQEKTATPKASSNAKSPPKSPSTPSSSSTNSLPGDSPSPQTVDDSDSENGDDDPYHTQSRMDELKFTPSVPPPKLPKHATDDPVNFRDIPMFTPRDALFDKEK